MEDNKIMIELREDGFIAFCKVKQMKEVVQTLRGEEAPAPKLRLRY